MKGVEKMERCFYCGADNPQFQDEDKKFCNYSHFMTWNLGDYKKESSESCPKCGGQVIQDDRAVYTRIGDVDQLVFWECQGCGIEW